MKIPSAFKLGELLSIVILCLATVFAIVWFVPEFLFKAAQFLWLPFLLASFLCVIRYAMKLFPHHEFISSPTGLFFSSIKIVGAFLLMIFCYFGFGQGLLLYQALGYDAANQPVITQFLPVAQLLWAIKLGLMTWVIASGLALTMAALNKDRISQFFSPIVNKYPHYALVFDSMIAFSMLTILMLFISIGCIEFARTITAFFGQQRPIFPELTALISVVTLLSGYYLFGLKKHHQNLVTKSVSVGRMYFMQGLWIMGLLLFAEIIIAYIPTQMIVSLMTPIRIVISFLSYETTWIYMTLAVAIISAPLLARYFTHLFAYWRIWQVFLILMLPVVISAILIYPITGLGWAPAVYFVPITLKNVIHQVQPGALILIASLLCLLLCFTYSKSLQIAMVDLLPKHIGLRLRRLRRTIAKQSLFLVALCSFYLIFANYGYYFLSIFLLVLVTLSLLWVSVRLLYTLILK